MRRLSGAIALLLAGCAAGSGAWTKAGADQTATAQAYEECREMAGIAVSTDAAIDQDILASRQSDWQRAGVVRTETRTMQEQTRDRAAAIIASCMQAKGYRATR
jgi:hypothetical protein